MDKNNAWTLIASHDAREGSLPIDQYAFVSVGVFDTETTYTLRTLKNGIFLMCISGGLEVGEYTLKPRDVLEITEVNDLAIKPTSGSQVLLIEVPMGV